jgi:hypothetical protein
MMNIHEYMVTSEIHLEISWSAFPKRVGKKFLGVLTKKVSLVGKNLKNSDLLYNQGLVVRKFLGVLTEMVSLVGK